MEFSTREIAAGFWFAALFVWVSYQAGSALLAVLRAMLGRSILGVMAVALVYIAGSVKLLQTVGLWTASNLKTTTLWAFTVGAISVFRANKIDENPQFFRQMLRETLSITVLIQFLVDTYTFGIFTEFIMVPVIALLSMMLAVAKPDLKSRPVASLLEWILVFVGFVYVAHAFNEAWNHWQELKSLDTAREILVPIALSLLFMPMLFGLNVYIVYEQIYRGLDWAIDDCRIRRYAKWRAFYTFGANLDLLKRWRRLAVMEHPTDKCGVSALFEEVISTHRKEMSPSVVAPSHGWSPFTAAKFLSDEGHATDDYHRSFDTWSSASRAETLGKTYSLNNITYRVEGSADIATELSLELRVYNPINGEEGTSEFADDRFGKLAGLLLKAAIDESSLQQFKDQLGDGTQFQITTALHDIRMTREDWTHGSGGYKRELIIAIKAEGGRSSDI